MRVLSAVGLAAAVALPTVANAQTVCPYIREAEAVGVVVDQGAGKIAFKNWRNDEAAAPVLTFAAKEVGAGDTMSGFLTKSGFLPDKYNLNVTATLNPDIGNLDKLKVGEIVRIPVLDDSFGYAASFDGYKTWQMVAEKWGTGSSDSASLTPLLALVDDASSKYREQPAWSELVEAARAIPTDVKRGKPTNAFYGLEQNIATYQTNEFLQKLMLTDDKIISDPKSGAFAVVAKAALDMTAARGAGRATLSVKTVSPANVELPDLRVFRVSEASYRLNCLEENKVEFEKRSSPATAVLPIAKWWVWAEDETGRKSRPREVPLASPEMKIDYTVEWAGG